MSKSKAQSSRKPPAPRKPAPPRVTVWERFSVKALSPSQLASFATDPGLWYARSRAKLYEDAGPAAWRGDAVEFGVYCVLTGMNVRDALEHALDTFDQREFAAAKEAGGEVSEEQSLEAAACRAEIRPALERAAAAAQALNLPRPLGYQLWAEAWLPSVQVPVRGKPDFALELAQPLEACGHRLPAGTRLCVDLKTTRQLPSEAQGPKPEHAQAAALYAHGRKEDFAAILYVSTAKAPKIEHRLFLLDAAQIRRQVNLVLSVALRLEWTLKAARALAVVSKRDQEVCLAEGCRPNLAARGGVFDVWSDGYAARAAETVTAWRL